MCGIVGYLGHREAWPIVLTGLQRLAYRGYDSAGIAIISPSGQLKVHKSVGKVKEIEASQMPGFPKGHLGLGHTRWATHGKPTDVNAHPHTDCRGDIAAVHNGIVENYLQIKERLLSQGHTFTSETDTEVIPHLIEEGLENGLSFEEAFMSMGAQLQGSQAIVAVCRGEKSARFSGGSSVAGEKGSRLRTPGSKLLAMRLGNAGGIVVAHRPGESMVSSDLQAIASFTDNVSFLEDGETAVLTEEKVEFFGPGGKPVEKSSQPVSPIAGWVDKEGYKHFMLKEIMEQPRVATNALSGRVNFESGEVVLDDFPLSDDEVRALQRVVLIGCGTSLHAAMVARYLLEDLAGIPAEVDNGSEYRYRSFHTDKRTLVISVGQSGETADTLAAMSSVLEKGGRLFTVCNVEGSQATRLAEGTLYMRSGPEIGVASTKTFIGSLIALSLLSVYLGQVRGYTDRARSREIVGNLARVPHLLGRILADQEPYERLARRYHRYDNFLYLGRGITYPIAIEGALKLKEISYIHAEGYPAGEMKHGPIALIDPGMPVVAIAPDYSLYDKMVNNIKEVKARDGIVIAIVTEGNPELPSQVDEVLYMPRCPEILTPLLATVPVQLLAYHIAVRRGCDVDQPRNLAKSVTVE